MAVIEKLKAKASKYKMASVAKIAFFWGGININLPSGCSVYR